MKNNNLVIAFVVIAAIMIGCRQSADQGKEASPATTYKMTTDIPA